MTGLSTTPSGVGSPYLQGKPTFDVRHSPARVGLLNEPMRRRKGV
jgi:hypothetical protein